MKNTKGMIVFKTVKLSEKLSKEELEKLRIQTAHKFFHASTYPSVYDPMGYSYGYADCTSEFTIKIEEVGFMSQDIESNIFKSYYINRLQVSKDTFDDVYNDIWNILQSVDNVRFAQQVKCNFPYSIITFVIAEEDNKVTRSTRGKRAECSVYDEYMGDEFNKWLDSTWFGSSKKETDDMMNSVKNAIFEEYNKAVEKCFMKRPKIINYKYNETTGETTIYWDDKTQTTVKADPDTEQSKYTGFVSACAKKLFGNKSTYLNQFDKWTVKIPERERLAAEKKAAEDKAREEAKAKRDAKKSKRKKQREIEKLAKQIADEYYAQELTEEAEKLAVKKYGVPKSYLDDYDCDCGNCNCKEFDVMDDDNITD